MSYVFFGLGCVFAAVFIGALVYEWWQDYTDYQDKL